MVTEGEEEKEKKGNRKGEESGLESSRGQEGKGFRFPARGFD